MITPKEIYDNPTDPLRIGPILYEIRGLWLEHPNLTLGQILCQVVELEYGRMEYIKDMTDSELIHTIQNYGEMGSI